MITVLRWSAILKALLAEDQEICGNDLEQDHPLFWTPPAEEDKISFNFTITVSYNKHKRELNMLYLHQIYLAFPSGPSRAW